MFFFWTAFAATTARSSNGWLFLLLLSTIPTLKDWRLGFCGLVAWTQFKAQPGKYGHDDKKSLTSRENKRHAHANTSANFQDGGNHLSG